MLGAIIAHDLTIGWTGHEPLRSASFAVQPGQIVGIIGPALSGKTTLLMALAGHERNLSGSLVVNDVDVMHATDPERAALRRNTTGLLTQRPALIGDLTIAANIELPLLHRNKQPRVRGQLVGAELRYFELGAVRDSLPHELSAIHHQLIALACAFAGEPPIVLLDEPMTQLPPSIADLIVVRVTTAASHGTTVVITAQRIDTLEFADQIITTDLNTPNEIPAFQS